MMIQIKEYGTRIDVYLAKIFGGKSRSSIVQSIEEGKILINGKRVKKNYKINFGDILEIVEERESSVDLKERMKEMPLEIVYEDEFLAIVNKPRGMLMYSVKPIQEITLAQLLKNKFKKLSNFAGIHREGIVHRLDRNTTGLLIIAKDNEVHKLLIDKMLNKEIEKYYLTIVQGIMKDSTGEIKLPIARDPKKRWRMCIAQEGREAWTKYETMQRMKESSLLKVQLLTGRTHQIRVHMEAVGNPILGDPVYFGNKFNKQWKLPGQMLHCNLLKFTHPISLRKIVVEREPDELFKNLLERLEQQ